jgi:hypothetical protein
MLLAALIESAVLTVRELPLRQGVSDGHRHPGRTPDIERLGYGTIWVAGSPPAELSFVEPILEQTATRRPDAKASTGTPSVPQRDGPGQTCVDSVLPLAVDPGRPLGRRIRRNRVCGVTGRTCILLYCSIFRVGQQLSSVSHSAVSPFSCGI